MQYQPTTAQRQDETQIDGTLVVGEALTRFVARVEEAARDMRREVAAHYGNPAYIADGSAAAAIVAGDARRARGAEMARAGR